MTKKDYSILDRFGFEHKPFGVRYSIKRPLDVPPLNRGIALCEIFKEAENHEPFYLTRDNISCGSMILGMGEFPPIMESGSLGSIFSMFKNSMANSRIYQYIPMLGKDTVRYVSISPLDRIPFEPDLLILIASVSQAEIILRASTYSSGKMWSNKGTTCLACSWIFAEPYKSGAMNYSISGLGYSMKARRVLPEGLFVFSIPADFTPVLFDNLNEMEWHPDFFDVGRDGFVELVAKREAEMKKDVGY